MLLTDKKSLACSKGFTIIELLIAMAVSGILMGAVFKIYSSQQAHYAAQLDVTEMQQNVRAALKLLSRDIRMAGYDNATLSVAGKGKAKIINAEPDLFYFSVDLNEDGDVNDTGEHIAYDLSDDSGIPTLRRTTSNTTIPVADKGGGHWEVTTAGQRPAADGIEQMEFFYLDKDRVLTTDEDKVRTVVISLLARAQEPDDSFSNNQVYTPASNLALFNTDPANLTGITWTVNDNYRRRLKIMTVECRNIGL